MRVLADINLRLRRVDRLINILWYVNVWQSSLSHIHVSAAYRSRIYENFDTPRSDAYFVQATCGPRTCDVPATFPWRISDISVSVWNFTFVCRAYQGVCATYV